jgi:hypothetical protein
MLDPSKAIMTMETGNSEMMLTISGKRPGAFPLNTSFVRMGYVSSTMDTQMPRVNLGTLQNTSCAISFASVPFRYVGCCASTVSGVFARLSFDHCSFTVTICKVSGAIASLR